MLSANVQFFLDDNVGANSQNEVFINFCLCSRV